MISADFTRARVNVRTRALGTAIAAPLAAQMAGAARAILGPDYRVVETGAFYRVADDSNRLVRAQVRSFSAALVLVFVAIGILFRSARLTLLSLLPNCLPILWTAGLMGVLGIDLSTGTAMIASAVIGLVVDDTIHYLTGFHRNLAGGPEAVVFLGTFTSKDPRGAVHVLSRSLLAVLPLAREYVKRNMRLIVAGAHGVPEDRARDIDPALAGRD